MIRTLQKRFVTITMAAMLIVVLAIGSAMFLSLNRSMTSDDQNTLEVLSENKGRIPEMNDSDFSAFMQRLTAVGINREAILSNRFFTVTYNTDGTVQVDLDHAKGADEDSARTYAESVRKLGVSDGKYGDYLYKITQDSSGTRVVFLSVFDTEQTLQWFARNAFYVGASAMVIMFILSMFMSQRAVKPFADNMNRQKQFITDAGHELKTPLAIISADTEVLELEVGDDNKWIESIHNQVKRLDKLIKSLLILSRAEEQGDKAKMADFDISAAVRRSAGNFESVAKSQGKMLTLDIADGLSCHGRQDDIEELTGILVDNAIKYSKEGETVTVSLARAKGRKIQLDVTNPCENMKDADLDNLFRRFYRADTSRARSTGGYGIGLSIATAVTEAHKGKISASLTGDGRICFTVVL